MTTETTYSLTTAQRHKIAYSLFQDSLEVGLIHNVAVYVNITLDLEAILAKDAGKFYPVNEM